MLSKVSELIRHLLPHISEYVELEKAKQEFEEYVTNTAYETLNNAEKYLYEHYQDSVLYQDSFDMFGDHNFTDSSGKPIICDRVYNEFWDYDKRYIDFSKKKVPILFNRALDNLNPEIRNNIFNRCSSCRKKAQEFDKRIDKIREVLNNPLLTLTILKEHFPELYTIYKSL